MASAAEARPRVRAVLVRPLLERVRPYWLHLYLLVYTGLLLYLDGQWRSFWPQCGLGVLTFLVLWLCTKRLERSQRRQVWLCVIVATGFEVLGSILIGVYRYRLHNVPLYVPPGHGLVFFFGMTAAATPVFQRYGRRAALVVLALCAAWALAGLTVLPVWTHRVDVQGALCLPIFAWFLIRSPRYAMFAAIFIATTDLEIVGTIAGDWYWMPVAPLNHLPSGNPPSAIAGGYCVIDSSVALVIIALSKVAAFRRLFGSVPPAAQQAAEAGPYDSRWRRMPSSEEPEPTSTPASRTSTAASSTT